MTRDDLRQIIHESAAKAKAHPHLVGADAIKLITAVEKLVEDDDELDRLLLIWEEFID